MKTTFYLIAIPPLVLAAIFLCHHGFQDSLYWTDFSILELQLLQILNGKLLFFGAHSKGGMFHLGPAWHYSILPIYALFHKISESIIVAVAVINALGLCGCAYLISSLPKPFNFVATPSILAGLWAMGPMLVNPWNAYMDMIPFALLILLAAFLSTGELKYLPWTAGVASWLVQCHFGTSFAVMAISFTATCLGIWCSRHRLELKWFFITCIVIGVFWILPVIEWNNLNNVFNYFLASHGAPQDMVGNLMAQAAGSVVYRTVSDLVPAGCEWVIGVTMIAGLAAVTAFAYYRRDYIIGNLGVLTLIGMGALYKSLYSCPFTIMWTYYSAWGWALGVFAFMLIVGTLLLRVPSRLTGYSSVVAAALLMLCWFPTLDAKTLAPDRGKLFSLEGKGSPPELIFDTRTNYLNGSPTVMWLYKHHKPFTTSHWKWPFNLPPSYAPKHPYPVCVIKMREECEGPRLRTKQ